MAPQEVQWFIQQYCQRIWLVVDLQYPAEKFEFVSWVDNIPIYPGKIIQMFQTTVVTMLKHMKVNGKDYSIYYGNIRSVWNNQPVMMFTKITITHFYDVTMDLIRFMIHFWMFCLPRQTAAPPPGLHHAGVPGCLEITWRLHDLVITWRLYDIIWWFYDDYCI